MNDAYADAMIRDIGYYLYDQSPDDYTKLVIDDLFNRRMEQANEDLRGGFDEAKAWRNALGAMSQRIDAKIAAFNAGLLQVQQQCFKMGDRGRNKYFGEKTRVDTKKSRLKEIKAIVISRIQEAKESATDAREAEDVDEPDSMKEQLKSTMRDLIITLIDTLERVETKLDAVLEKNP